MLLKTLSLLALLAGGPQGRGPTKVPEKCEDQCKMMVDMCKNGCGKTNKPQAQAMCSRNCSDIEKTCKGSCETRGVIDKDYMKQNLKAPKKPSGLPDRDH